MSTLAPGRAPADDVEVIRSINDRVRKLESARTTRIGSWVLQDIDGSLIATKAGNAAAIAGADVAEAVKVDLGDLSQYISQKDLNDAFKNFAGALTGPATAPIGSNPILLQLQQWASGLGGGLDISGIVGAITGVAGDLTDLAAWALTLPTQIIDGATDVLTTFESSMVDAITGTPGTLTDLAAWALSTLPGNINDAIDAALVSVNSNLTALGTQITDSIQDVIDNINASVGVAAGGLVSSIQAALTSFPPANIVGTFASTLVSDWNSLVNGITTAVGATGFPTSLASLNTVVGGISTLLGWKPTGSAPVDSTKGITTTNNSFIAALAGTKPSYQAIDPSADSTFGLSQIVGSSATTVSLTQTQSVMGAITIPYGGIDGVAQSLWPVKKAVCWLGSGPTSTTITAMWVVIWKLNTINGTAERVHVSPELIKSQGVATTLAWNYYNIPNSVDWISVKQGDWYVAELCLLGSGTYNVVGMPSNWMPQHPTVFPKAIGATRRPAALDATIANTGANGANNNSKSGVGTIDVTATIDPNDTCAIMFASAGGAAAAGTFSAQMVTGSRAMTQVAARQVSTANAFSNLYAFAIFFTNGSGKPCRAADLGLSGSQTFRLSQTAAIGTWNASVGVQSFIGPTAAGTPVTNSGISTVPNVTLPTSTANALSFAAVAFAGFGTMSGVTNWNNIAAGNVNVAGTFPLITGYANGPVTNTQYSTTMANTNWGGIVVPLLITAPIALPVPNTLGTAGTTVAYNSNIPWLALTGSAGTSQYPPDTQTFTSSGTYIKPPWANYFDIIVCGGGGAGVNGAAFVAGVGGNPGGWAGTTLAKTEPDVAAVSTFDVVVAGISGGNNGPSYVNINSVQKAYGYGGPGGVGFVAGAIGGVGVGSSGYTQNGITYPGGGNVPQQTPGSFPGGGGGGGNSATGGGTGPGYGQIGVVYIVARQ